MIPTMMMMLLRKMHILRLTTILMMLSGTFFIKHLYSVEHTGAQIVVHKLA